MRLSVSSRTLIRQGGCGLIYWLFSREAKNQAEEAVAKQFKQEATKLNKDTTTIITIRVRGHGGFIWRLARSHREGSICQLEAVTSTILSTDRLLQAVVLQAKAGVLRPLSQFGFVPDEVSQISSGDLSAWTGSGKRRKVNSHPKRLHLRCGETIDKQLAWPFCKNLLTCMKLLSWRRVTTSWFYCIKHRLSVFSLNR